YAYSNTGFVLLGRVVEKASGQPLEKVYAERLWKPAGMTHTSLEPNDAPDLAKGHRAFAFEEPRSVPREPPHWLWAAGAMYATAPDLANWEVALADGRILEPPGIRAMMTARTLTSGRSAGYGCGLTVSTRENETVVSHGGAVSGFLADVAAIPRTRTAVAVL